MAYFQRISVARDALGPPPAAAARLGGPLFANLLPAIVRWIGDCAEALADYYAAASMYEQLSGLSDAELQRRQLSRANLGRDVLAMYDRSKRLG